MIDNKLNTHLDNILSNENNFFFYNKRREAVKVIQQNGIMQLDEDLKSSKLHKFLSREYSFNSIEEPSDDVFECMIDNFKSYTYCLENASHISKHFNDNINIEVDNIINASNKVEDYLGSLVDIEENGLYALNTAAFTGGFYINIPDNELVEIPIQLLSAYNSDTNAFYNSRNVIIVGKNAQVKIIQCDDVYTTHDFFINNMTEIFVKENAHVELYKMHNLANNTGMVNSIFIDQDSSSVVRTFNIEFNAGYILGNHSIRLSGENAENSTFGVYLADKQQEMDNYVCVEHIGVNNQSNQIFKGLIDDNARSTFVGKIIVHRDSQGTSASQLNNNILLSPKARAYSKPYLEIYADNVKCSHGATTGQIDEEALFYMQQRGLSFDTARKLLLNAFVSEVIEQINIEPIKVKISDMVKKRLTGELTQCNNCILRCSESKKQKNNLSY